MNAPAAFLSEGGSPLLLGVDIIGLDQDLSDPGGIRIDCQSIFHLSESPISLHRGGLCQVSGLVDIATADLGRVISQEL